MRSSLITMASLASLAVASPMLKNLKKAIIWDYVTDIVYVTVTDGASPKTTSAVDALTTTVVIQHTKFAEAPLPTSTKTRSKISKTKVVVPTTTSTPPPPPPPAPTTSTTPPPAPVTTQAPAPEPTTEAPAPAPTTEAPAPAPTTEAPAPAPTTLKSVVVAAAVASPSPVVAAQESAAAKPAADALPSDFASTGVYYHNKHRANHSAPAVTWDADLAKYAQTLADTCTFHHDLTIGGGGYGQNIDSVGMAGSGTETSVPAWDKSAVLANSITNNWYYAEVGAYANDYNVATPVEGAVQLYHFTQIVWKKSTTVGCAVSYCGQKILPSNYGWFAVCNYGPAGNFLGDFPKEVTPPIGNPALKVATPWA